MIQPTESGSADIRRALERLQGTLEQMADRYRELRRERKQLRAQVEELQQEREGAEAQIQARLETATVDRKRAIELEDRVAQAEKRNAELHDRLRELDARLAERESFIVEQEEIIVSLHSRIETEQQQGEQDRQTQEQVDALQAEAGQLRQQVADGRTERGRLQEQQRQLVAKLDASTRDAGLARTRVAELEEQLRQGGGGDDEHLQSMREKVEALTRDLSDALDMAARKELDTADKTREMESLRRSLDEANRQAETLRTRCKELTAEVDRRVVESASLNGAAVHDDDRRDMVEQIRQAIRLIDKHLEGT